MKVVDSLCAFLGIDEECSLLLFPSHFDALSNLYSYLHMRGVYKEKDFVMTLHHQLEVFTQAVRFVEECGGFVDSINQTPSFTITEQSLSLCAKSPLISVCAVDPFIGALLDLSSFDANQLPLHVDVSGLLFPGEALVDLDGATWISGDFGDGAFLLVKKNPWMDMRPKQERDHLLHCLTKKLDSWKEGREEKMMHLASLKEIFLQGWNTSWFAFQEESLLHKFSFGGKGIHAHLFATEMEKKGWQLALHSHFLQQCGHPALVALSSCTFSYTDLMTLEEANIFVQDSHDVYAKIRPFTEFLIAEEEYVL